MLLHALEVSRASNYVLGSVQDRIAVDEAHCVSQWGAPQQSHVPLMPCLHTDTPTCIVELETLLRTAHSHAGHDFRPDYKGLSVFKRRCVHLTPRLSLPLSNDGEYQTGS